MKVNFHAEMLENLSGTTLNSLLLEIFQKKSLQIQPAELLRTWRENRFVRPAAVEAVEFGEFLLDGLRAAQAAGFEPLELSPVAPLGTCSAVATVSQHKILSALRGTEVVADATNVLALEASERRRSRHFPADVVHLCAAHRQLRTQVFDFEGFTPHFSIFCAVSAGRDRGNFDFEKENLLRHLQFYYQFLSAKTTVKNLKIHLFDLADEGADRRIFEKAHDHLRQNEPSWHIETERKPPTAGRDGYYQDLQFKIFAAAPDGKAWWDIGDGGFVHWTQTLTANRKERCLISGIGAEFVFKFFRKKSPEIHSPAPPK